MIWLSQKKLASRLPLDFGSFKDNQHSSITFGDGTVWPLYQGNDVLTQTHDGMGALGWGSFAANAYNRASGTGSVAMGFNNIAGVYTADNGNFGRDENNGGQAVFGRASRATGPYLLHLDIETLHLEQLVLQWVILTMLQAILQ